jgi:starch-binding outer membrane protein, SusD/RagB family
MRIMRTTRRRTACVSVLAVALAAGACKDISVPDYNRASTGDLINAPNKTLVDAAAAGVIHNARRDPANRTRVTGIVGREAYILDTNEPRNVTELVTGAIDPSSFTGNHDYNNPYGTIAQGRMILAALEKVGPNEYTNTQKEALRGFAYTMMGNDMLVIAYMHQFGPIDVDLDPLAPPLPMKTQAEMYAQAANFLDSAVAHLKAGGTSFTFPFPSGFTQFTTGAFTNPSTGFLKFNRALRSRLDILRKDYVVAKIHLDSTFLTLDPTRAGMNLGVYYTYGAGSGDIPNALGSGTTEVAEPSLRTAAQLKLDGTRDTRYTLKVDSGAVRSQLGISSFLRYAHYKSRPFFGPGTTASPIPWIRNEELILDRAEARWYTGDLAGATADLNFVRTNSGGLPAIAQPATTADFVTALLYERRFSLMYEGGHRWLDLRRFNMLSTLDNYPRAGDKSITFWPVPFSECLARGGAGSAPGC